MRLYREDLLPERRNAVMISILDDLVRKSGPAAILAIRRGLGIMFGLNVIGANEAAQTIDAWLAVKK